MKSDSLIYMADDAKNKEASHEKAAEWKQKVDSQLGIWICAKMEVTGNTMLIATGRKFEIEWHVERRNKKARVAGIKTDVAFILKKKGGKLFRRSCGFFRWPLLFALQDPTSAWRSTRWVIECDTVSRREEPPYEKGKRNWLSFWIISRGLGGGCWVAWKGREWPDRPTQWKGKQPKSRKGKQWNQVEHPATYSAASEGGGRSQKKRAAPNNRLDIECRCRHWWNWSAITSFWLCDFAWQGFLSGPAESTDGIDGPIGDSQSMELVFANVSWGLLPPCHLAPAIGPALPWPPAFCWVLSSSANAKGKRAGTRQTKEDCIGVEEGGSALAMSACRIFRRGYSGADV